MFKKILSLLLLATLFTGLLASCNPTVPEPDPEPKPEPKPERTGPYLVVNGVDISKFAILKEYDEYDEIYKQIGDTIYDFCGERLAVTTETDSPYLVRIAEDFSLNPNEYCLRVAEGELRLGVFSRSFSGAVTRALWRLMDSLTGDAVLKWNNGYCEKGTFEQSATAYRSVRPPTHISVYGGSDMDPLTYVDQQSTACTITFRLACVAGDQLVSVPYIKYEIHDETTGKTESGYKSASSGTVTIPYKTTGKDGTVYLNATACDESKNKITSRFSTAVDDDYHFRGSAVINRKNITMSAPVPDDFDAFWQEQVDALYSQPVEILKMTEKTSTESGFRLFYVELRCNVNAGETDGIASGYLSYPKSASKNAPVDMRVAFMGKGFNPAEILYYDNTATFSVCAHSIDCERAGTDLNYLKTQQSKDTIDDESTYTNREDFYFRGMILRDLQAARFMVEYFGENGLGDGKGKGLWNGKNFTASGGSQGGFQSIAVAALDHNITYLDVSRPWVSDVKASGRLTNSKQFYNHYTPAFEYYDTTSFAHLVTCKTNVSMNLGDLVSPVSGVLSFYNALTCEKKLICYQNASHMTRVQPGFTIIHN